MGVLDAGVLLHHNQHEPGKPDALIGFVTPADLAAAIAAFKVQADANYATMATVDAYTRVVSATKTVDQSIVDTNNVDDADLRLNLKANQSYEILGFLFYSSGTVDDLRLNFVLPTGATASRWSAGGTNSSAASAATTQSFAAITGGSSTVVGGVGTATILYARPVISITMGSSDGTLILRWTQGSLDAANPLTLYAGSELLAIRKGSSTDGYIAPAAPDTVTDTVLKAWTQSVAYVTTSVTRDADTGAVTSANVRWPDGGTGVLTVISRDSVYGFIDSYTISYIPTNKLVTQPAVTRDINGNVTVQPALTVGVIV